jgi:hypothetical protein
MNLPDAVSSLSSFGGEGRGEEAPIKSFTVRFIESLHAFLAHIGTMNPTTAVCSLSTSGGEGGGRGGPLQTLGPVHGESRKWCTVHGKGWGEGQLFCLFVPFCGYLQPTVHGKETLRA